MGIHIIEGKDQGGPSAAALQKFLATQISLLKGGKFHHSFYIIVHKSHLVSFYPSLFPLPLPSFHSIQKFCSHFAEFITSFFHISTNLYHKSLWLHLQSARRVSNIMATPSGAHSHPHLSVPCILFEASLSYKRLLAINSSTKL